MVSSWNAYSLRKLYLAAFGDDFMASVVHVHNILEKLEYVSGMLILDARRRCTACVRQDSPKGLDTPSAFSTSYCL